MLVNRTEQLNNATSLRSNETSETITFRERVIFVLLLSMGTVFTLFGNLTLCIAVCTVKKLRRVHNAFYVNLAMADIFVTVVMAFSVVSLINEPFDDAIPSASSLEHRRSNCLLWLSLDLMSSVTVILSIAVLTANMHVHIIYPFKYEELIRKRWLIVLTVSCIWCLSALSAFLPIQLGWQSKVINQVSHVESLSSVGLCRCHFAPAYVIVLATVCFCVPGVLICVLNFRLYHHSQYHYSNIKKTSSMCSSLNALTVNNASTPTYATRNLVGESFNLSGSSACINHHGVSSFAIANANTGAYLKRGGGNGTVTGNGNGNLNRWFSRSQNLLNMHSVMISSQWMLAQLPTGRLKAVRTLGVMTVSFLICWGGFYVAMLLNSFSGTALSDRTLLIVSVIAYYNSCLNPLIYTRFNHDFHQAFSFLFCRRSSYERSNGVDDSLENRRRRGSMPNAVQCSVVMRQSSDEVALSDGRLRRFYSCSALI